MKPRQGNITIRMADTNNRKGRPLKIGADIYGVWAVHMLMTIWGTQHSDRWTVSHVPTGYGISVDASEAVARRIAYRFSQVCGARTKSGVLNVKAKLRAIITDETPSKRRKQKAASDA